MKMYVLWMKDIKGRVYFWLGEHRYTENVTEAKRFPTKAEAEVERWGVAGTDTQIAEVLA